MAETMFGLQAIVTLHKNSITNYTLDPDHLVDERMGQSLLYTVKSHSVSELKGSGKTPWIGTHVIIHGKSGPLHTKIGIVRDVICGQRNKSGLCVVLILDNYDPSLTNKEYMVDYEHVLEVITFCPLHLFQPLKDLQSAFLPKPRFIRSGHEEAIASAATTQRGMIQLEHPESMAEHLDPAWDPRSPAPVGLLPTPDLPNLLAFEHHDHWVTDICLLTYRLCVQVSGKPMTMTTKYNALSEKLEAYIHKGKKKKKVLESYQFIQPMEPSTPRHYDRWIIIKGDHAGSSGIIVQDKRLSDREVHTLGMTPIGTPRSRLSKSTTSSPSKSLPTSPGVVKINKLLKDKLQSITRSLSPNPHSTS
ncbi:hypothetical protein IW261DRAFT_1572273 [Armillaria novae-zelandiae]|uniref:Uncharacterized protein n=1 Tax=Armillaria novae-zelandiae TaxID=153914 RepID=A0AA39TZZ7_9AGAR|nr:hypothetical protein IW261DRAFT_1572273 [Armillaria novae-zelandiae]